MKKAVRKDVQRPWVVVKIDNPKAHPVWQTVRYTKEDAIMKYGKFSFAEDYALGKVVCVRLSVPEVEVSE